MSRRNSRQKLKRRRKYLWKEDPRCRICRVGTVLPEDLPQKEHPDGRIQPAVYPDNMATLEHQNSAWKKRSGTARRPGKPATTLLCKRCNEERAAREEAAAGLHVLHRRSGRSGEGA